jgi:hypothetical protein
MPVVEINLSHYVRALVRLDGPTAEQIDPYATFVHASADEVVDKALNYVFSQDGDFQDFLKTPRAQQDASTLRVRRGPNKASKNLDTPSLKGLTFASNCSQSLAC